jgi:hypothetical protein
VKGKNRVLILCFMYSLNVQLPSYRPCPWGNRNGNRAYSRVILCVLELKVLLRNVMDSHSLFSLYGSYVPYYIVV